MFDLQNRTKSISIVFKRVGLHNQVKHERETLNLVEDWRISLKLVLLSEGS